MKYDVPGMAEQSKANDAQVEQSSDWISLSIAQAFSATLDHASGPKEGDALPPLWHWAFFWPKAPMAQIGEDGHPQKGGFMPDLGLPRRMAAGARLKFSSDLKIGSAATRSSRILKVEQKEGRSGRLGFVTVAHSISCDGNMAIQEEQDIVYREAAATNAPAPDPKPARDDHLWERQIHPSEALLFRYSALTFNAHRIHYDRAYARDVEGYADLVIHGPLVATLLADLVARQLPDSKLASYEYRALRPLMLGNSFLLCGRPSEDGKTVELWTRDHQGAATMSAKASLV